MKRYMPSTRAIVALAAAAWVAAAGTARADGLVANWTLGAGGAAGNSIGNGAAVADSGPYGYNGTVVSGGDTIESVAGVIGNGLWFDGDNSSTMADISVPAGANLGGMSNLTISLWLNIPALNGTTPGDAFGAVNKAALDLWDAGGSSPSQSYLVGTRYSAVTTENGVLFGLDSNTVYDHAYVDASGNKGFWNRTDGTGWTGGAWEQLTIEYCARSVGSTGTGYQQYYVNGIYVGSGPCGAVVIPTVGAGQTALIGEDWYGALNDIGIWKTNLTGAFSFATEVADNGAPSSITEGMPAGGEVGALYNTPMYNNNTGPLSQYGVKAMDQLFTLFDGANPRTVAVVTTSNSTLGWRYVAGALTLGSGAAGQPVAGQYAVQLDSAGDGVETVLFGDANLDGNVDINDLTVVLANYGQTGMTWTQGEFTGSGTVDINDLTIVLANYGQTDGSSAIGLSAVPEPGAMAILAAGAAGLLACAWRRRRQHCPPARDA